MVGVSSEGLTASVQSPQSHFCDVAGLNAHARPGQNKKEGKVKGASRERQLCGAGRRECVYTSEQLYNYRDFAVATH